MLLFKTPQSWHTYQYKSFRTYRTHRGSLVRFGTHRSYSSIHPTIHPSIHRVVVIGNIRRTRTWAGMGRPRFWLIEWIISRIHWKNIISYNHYRYYNIGMDEARTQLERECIWKICVIYHRKFCFNQVGETCPTQNIYILDSKIDIIIVWSCRLLLWKLTLVTSINRVMMC